MRKYIEITKIVFKTQITWRFDTVMNALFTIGKIVFAYMIWSNMFSGHDLIAGFTFHSMLSYYIINSFLSQLDMSDGVSGEISSRIRSGTFSKYMVIPVNIQGYFIAQTVGASMYYMVFNLFAAFISVFVFGIRFTFTTNPVLIISALALVLLGILFMIQLNYFLGLLTLKFQDIYLFLMIKNNLLLFITGSLIPLTLLPEIIVKIMRYLPFYYVTYLPSMLFIGRGSDEIMNGLLCLPTWIVAFIVINKVSFRRLRVRYDGVGI